MNINEEYLKIAIRKFKDVKELGDKTIQQLDTEALHWTYNEATNSIAMIVKHMRGNMISRWTDIFTSDGEKSDRHRDSEFEDPPETYAEIVEAWNTGWRVLFDTLESLSGDDLLKTVEIRGAEHTVIEAIERQISHYSYHVGQMVFTGKQIKGHDWRTLSIPKGRSEQYLKRGRE
ncbi:DinB family protein [Salinicoccus halodurans]|uniref:DUF1572 domain-containing protein n=1 Tax=Salinicoccus halodurans TaxID=407035 RepID=A0A0F7HJ27_9STAP|nr:DinB family protein [Salinicoccus halodurans]AKG73577.1 hypothetical protein AAT16_04720 [Salinicoccus halodurans]SFK52848.1 Protein of unknown function [Salinicoccus halodurans]